jgi:L-aminopeptidase/D-esterase-like protein
MLNGFAIGHHTAEEPGWLTGTTVLFARDGATGGVAVRGGGPGTRETDLLDPTAMVERVNAVVLTGGSAYGLAAADGVMRALERESIGFPLAPLPLTDATRGLVVPIVPAAVIFDLGRGGAFGHRPTAEFGALAYAAASAAEPGTDPARGCVGAGTGAVCGGLKGGFGYAEQSVPGGGMVAAAVVVNAAGSAVSAETGRLYGDLAQRLAQPGATEIAALAEAGRQRLPPFAKTIGDLTLTKPQASRLAAVGHDGMARAIRPLHAMVDGDTVFCLAAGRSEPPALPELDLLLAAGADVFTAACIDAMLSATGRGQWPAYVDLVPAARGGRPFLDLDGPLPPTDED